MKRRIGLIMAVLMRACSAPGQADEAAAIKKNLEQMWSDVALGKIDSSNFGKDTLTAYSSGGLWQKGGIIFAKKSLHGYDLRRKRTRYIILYYL